MARFRPTARRKNRGGWLAGANARVACEKIMAAVKAYVWRERDTGVYGCRENILRGECAERVARRRKWRREMAGREVWRAGTGARHRPAIANVTAR